MTPGANVVRRRAKLWALAAAIGLGGAGLPACGEPEIEPSPLERAQRLQESHRTAEEQARAARRPALELGLRERTGESPGQIRRRLLAEYGVALTPFQRSALQAARISTYAEGAEMCEKWVEGNRRFERGE